MKSQDVTKKASKRATNHESVREFAKKRSSIHFMMTQLNFLTAQLNRPPSVEQIGWSVQKKEDYVRRLTEQRAELLEKLKSERIAESFFAQSAPKMSRRVPGILDKISTEYFIPPWIEIAACDMIEGFNQTPASVGDNTTSGQIVTAQSNNGNVVFYGDLFQPAQDPHDAWWEDNWSCSIVFPKVEREGVLSYRFTVDAALTCYTPLPMGAASEWINVGTTSDYALQPFANGFFAWAMNTNFTSSSSSSFGQSVPVYGTINVSAGQTPAINILYGVTVGISGGGEFDMLVTDNYFTTRVTRLDFSPTDVGKIEYQFFPKGWIDEVTNISSILKGVLP